VSREKSKHRHYLPRIEQAAVYLAMMMKAAAEIAPIREHTGCSVIKSTSVLLKTTNITKSTAHRVWLQNLKSYIGNTHAGHFRKFVINLFANLFPIDCH